MEFHTMKRKDLQALCKKHNLPANTTNLEMADKLTSLLKGEEKPRTRGRSCLKDSNEVVGENGFEVLTKKSKKVRFSFESEDIEFVDLENEPEEKKLPEKRKSDRRRSMIKLEPEKPEPSTDHSEEVRDIPVRMTRNRAKKPTEEEVTVVPSPSVEKKKPRRRAANSEKIEVQNDGVSDKDEQTEEVRDIPVRKTRSRAKNSTEEVKSVSVRDNDKHFEEVQDIPVRKTRSLAKKSTEEEEKNVSVRDNDKHSEEVQDIPVRKTRSLAKKSTEGEVINSRLSDKEDNSEEIRDIPVRKTRSRAKRSTEGEVKNVSVSDKNEPSEEVRQIPVRRKRSRADSTEGEVIMAQSPFIQKKKARRGNFEMDEMRNVGVSDKPNHPEEIRDIPARKMRSRGEKSTDGEEIVAPSPSIEKKKAGRVKNVSATERPPVENLFSNEVTEDAAAVETRMPKARSLRSRKPSRLRMEIEADKKVAVLRKTRREIGENTEASKISIVEEKTEIPAKSKRAPRQPRKNALKTEVTALGNSEFVADMDVMEEESVAEGTNGQVSLEDQEEPTVINEVGLEALSVSNVLHVATELSPTAAEQLENQDSQNIAGAESIDGALPDCVCVASIEEPAHASNAEIISQVDYNGLAEPVESIGEEACVVVPDQVVSQADGFSPVRKSEDSDYEIDEARSAREHKQPRDSGVTNQEVEDIRALDFKETVESAETDGLTGTIMHETVIEDHLTDSEENGSSDVIFESISEEVTEKGGFEFFDGDGSSWNIFKSGVKDAEKIEVATHEVAVKTVSKLELEDKGGSEVKDTNEKVAGIKYRDNDEPIDVEESTLKCGFIFEGLFDTPLSAVNPSEMQKNQKMDADFEAVTVERDSAEKDSDEIEIGVKDTGKIEVATYEVAVETVSKLELDSIRGSEVKGTNEEAAVEKYKDYGEPVDVEENTPKYGFMFEGLFDTPSAVKPSEMQKNQKVDADFEAVTVERDSAEKDSDEIENGVKDAGKIEVATYEVAVETVSKLELDSIRGSEVKGTNEEAAVEKYKDYGELVDVEENTPKYGFMFEGLFDTPSAVKPSEMQKNQEMDADFEAVTVERERVDKDSDEIEDGVKDAGKVEVATCEVAVETVAKLELDSIRGSEVKDTNEEVAVEKYKDNGEPVDAEENTPKYGFMFEGLFDTPCAMKPSEMQKNQEMDADFEAVTMERERVDKDSDEIEDGVKDAGKVEVATYEVAVETVAKLKLDSIRGSEVMDTNEVAVEKYKDNGEPVDAEENTPKYGFIFEGLFEPSEMQKDHKMDANFEAVAVEREKIDERDKDFEATEDDKEQWEQNDPEIKETVVGTLRLGDISDFQKSHVMGAACSLSLLDIGSCLMETPAIQGSATRDESCVNYMDSKFRGKDAQEVTGSRGTTDFGFEEFEDPLNEYGAIDTLHGKLECQDSREILDGEVIAQSDELELVSEDLDEENVIVESVKEVRDEKLDFAYTDMVVNGKGDEKEHVETVGEKLNVVCKEAEGEKVNAVYLGENFDEENSGGNLPENLYVIGTEDIPSESRTIPQLDELAETVESIGDASVVALDDISEVPPVHQLESGKPNLHLLDMVPEHEIDEEPLTSQHLQPRDAGVTDEEGEDGKAFDCSDRGLSDCAEAANWFTGTIMHETDLVDHLTYHHETGGSGIISETVPDGECIKDAEKIQEATINQQVVSGAHEASDKIVAELEINCHAVSEVMDNNEVALEKYKDSDEPVNENLNTQKDGLVSEELVDVAPPNPEEPSDFEEVTVGKENIERAKEEYEFKASEATEDEKENTEQEEEDDLLFKETVEETVGAGEISDFRINHELGAPHPFSFKDNGSLSIVEAPAIQDSAADGEEDDPCLKCVTSDFIGKVAQAVTGAVGITDSVSKEFEEPLNENEAIRKLECQDFKAHEHDAEHICEVSVAKVQDSCALGQPVCGNLGEASILNVDDGENIMLESVKDAQDAILDSSYGEEGLREEGEEKELLETMVTMHDVTLKEAEEEKENAMTLRELFDEDDHGEAAFVIHKEVEQKLNSRFWEEVEENIDEGFAEEVQVNSISEESKLTVNKETMEKELNVEICEGIEGENVSVETIARNLDGEDGADIVFVKPNEPHEMTVVEEMKEDNWTFGEDWEGDSSMKSEETSEVPGVNEMRADDCTFGENWDGAASMKPEESSQVQFDYSVGIALLTSPTVPKCQAFGQSDKEMCSPEGTNPIEGVEGSFFETEKSAGTKLKDLGTKKTEHEVESFIAKSSEIVIEDFTCAKSQEILLADPTVDTGLERKSASALEVGDINTAKSDLIDGRYERETNASELEQDDQEDLLSSLGTLFAAEEGQIQQSNSDCTGKENVEEAKMEEVDTLLGTLWHSTTAKKRDVRSSFIQNTPKMKTFESLKPVGLQAVEMKENTPSMKGDLPGKHTVEKSGMKRRALEDLQNSRRVDKRRLFNN